MAGDCRSTSATASVVSERRLPRRPRAVGADTRFDAPLSDPIKVEEIIEDKGFDPLLLHMNSVGFECRRADSLDELAPGDESVSSICGRSSMIEHYGAR